MAVDTLTLTCSAAAEREVRRDSPLRRARTRYDHLAGVAGVELFDELARRGWLVCEPSADASRHPRCYLTADGEAALSRLGAEVAGARAARRAFAYACLDWTERRPHLGGALGAALLNALQRDGVVARDGAGRTVRLLAPLDAWLDG
jgi:hypothetical protein